MRVSLGDLWVAKPPPWIAEEVARSARRVDHRDANPAFVIDDGST